MYVKDLPTSCRYSACIGTAAALYALVSMILLDYAPAATWSVVLGIIAISLVTQGHVSGSATQDSIRNAHIFMIGAVPIVFVKLEDVAVLEVEPWLSIVMGIVLAGLLGLWLVRDRVMRQYVLVWSLRSCFLAIILCISLAKPESFTLYLDKEGKLSIVFGVIGLGLPSYWLRLSRVEFTWTTSMLMGVTSPFWIFGRKNDVDTWHVVVFNAVVHSVSTLVFALLCECRSRTFSPEWMHAIAAKNVFCFACTAMCIALYCYLMAQMLLFAMFLADCGVIYLLLHQH